MNEIPTTRARRWTIPTPPSSTKPLESLRDGHFGSALRRPFSADLIPMVSCRFWSSGLSQDGRLGGTFPLCDAHVDNKARAK